jgi:hypothetical protein
VPCGEHVAGVELRFGARRVDVEGLHDLVVPLAGAHLRDDRPERIVDGLGIGQRIVVRRRHTEQLVIDPDVRDRPRDVGGHRHLGLAEQRREPLYGELLRARLGDDIGVRAHRLLESLTGDENADDHEYG